MHVSHITLTRLVPAVQPWPAGPPRPQEGGLCRNRGPACFLLNLFSTAQHAAGANRYLNGIVLLILISQVFVGSCQMIIISPLTEHPGNNQRSTFKCGQREDVGCFRSERPC